MKSSLRSLIIGGGLVIVLIGLMWIAKPSPTPTSSSSQGSGALVAAESSFDFGAVSMARGNVSHTYSVRNTNSEPITITKLYTSCMCTTATLVTPKGRKGPFGMPGHGPIPKIQAELAPGQEFQVEVIFDPTAHGPAGVGRVERIVFVEHSAGKPLELQFTANVTP